MKYTNLADCPVYYKDTIELIEKSFDYSKENSFDIDFYPLMSKSNQKNCHIITIENQVVAHIGVLEKSITVNNKIYPIAMYGGISVDENHRGKGLFKSLFNEILQLYKEKALHLLWSDQLEMYQSFGFHAAIEQIEYNQSLDDATEFEPTKLNTLSDDELNNLKEIYNSSNEIRINRSDNDWEILKNITSSDLYLKRKNNIITNYFFMNKGEDLNGVVIEIGCLEDLEEIVKYGVTWSPINYSEDNVDHLYAAVLKVGDEKIFSEFIHNLTNELIVINQISENSIKFSFDNNKYDLTHAEVLTGVFGPGQFDELKDCKPFYISGLDSI